MSADIACFFAGSYIRSRFLFGMISTWNWEDMSLFECQRSDLVLHNVVLITRGTIFFTPQNAQLLLGPNTLPFNWYFEGSVLGFGMCLNCLLSSCLLASTKDKKKLRKY